MSDCVGLDLFVLVAPKETAFSPKTVTVVTVAQAMVEEGLAEWNRPEIMNEGNWYLGERFNETRSRSQWLIYY